MPLAMSSSSTCRPLRASSARSSLSSAPLLRRPGSAARAPLDDRRRWRAAAGDDSAASSSGKSDAESSFEDLFAQELKRRGIDEAAAKGSSSSSPPKAAAAARGPAADPFASGAAPSSPRSSSGPRDETRQQRAGPNDATAAQSEDQRERSMRLVSEGLDGLLPRARELLLLGGSVFLGFLPAMLIFSLVFTGIFSVFGDNFVHGGRQGALPTYVDPEQLLAEPTVDRFVPFRPDDGF
jgi:hypothetical protein